MNEAAPLLPLSLSQREVWLDQRAWPGSAHLHIGGFAFLHGPLDLGLLRQSLQQLVDEHEALRLQMTPDGRQLLHPRYAAALEILALPADQDLRAAMLTWWQRECHQRFDLEAAPAWRLSLIHI